MFEEVTCLATKEQFRHHLSGELPPEFDTCEKVPITMVCCMAVPGRVVWSYSCPETRAMQQMPSASSSTP